MTAAVLRKKHSDSTTAGRSKCHVLYRLNIFRAILNVSPSPQSYGATFVLCVVCHFTIESVILFNITCLLQIKSHLYYSLLRHFLQSKQHFTIRKRSI